MCGRYESMTKEQAFTMFGEAANDMTFGEVFPTNMARVQIASGFVTMKWGVPKWEGSGSVINARQETLLRKSFFRSDLLERRCVMFVPAFYEWGSQKQKNIIREQGKDLMNFAGIYKIIDGEPCFVIITQEASAAFCVLHNRMPLILSDDEVVIYLQGEHLEQWTKPKYDIDLVWQPVKGETENLSLF